MYTLLAKKDNLFVTSVKERIVQKTKLTNTVRILVTNEHNGVNMKDCLAIMYYKLPISDEWRSKELTPSEELYQNKYVEYLFPTDTWLTSEYGDVVVELRFYNVSLNDGINVDQYLRKITDGIIHISCSKDWASGIADDLLSPIDQRIIQIMMVQNRQEEMMNEVQANEIETLAVTDGKLHLVTTSGNQKGDTIDIVLPRTQDDDGINDGLIELDKVEHNESNPDCDCGCDHDNFEELENYVADSNVGNGNFSEL